MSRFGAIIPVLTVALAACGGPQIIPEARGADESLARVTERAPVEVDSKPRDIQAETEEAFRICSQADDQISAAIRTDLFTIGRAAHLLLDSDFSGKVDPPNSLKVEDCFGKVKNDHPQVIDEFARCLIDGKQPRTIHTPLELKGEYPPADKVDANARLMVCSLRHNFLVDLSQAIGIVRANLQSWFLEKKPGETNEDLWRRIYQD